MTKNILSATYTAVLLATATVFSQGCGAVDDDSIEPTDDDGELGTVEQAVTASCASPNAFGVDAGSGSMLRCNKNSSSNGCHFPGRDPLGAEYFFSNPFKISVTSGWTTTERNELSAAFTQAATFIDNTFRSCLTPNAPASPHFAVDWQNTIPSTRVKMQKGTIGGPPLVTGGTSGSWSSMMSLVCDESATFSESYPASFRGCTHWVATVDYNKIKAWFPSGRFQVMKNLTKQVFAQVAGLGYGSPPGQGLNNAYVLNESVSGVADKTLWDGVTGAGEVAWVCNYLRNPPDTNASFIICQ